MAIVLVVSGTRSVQPCNMAKLILLEDVGDPDDVELAFLGSFAA